MKPIASFLLALMLASCASSPLRSPEIAPPERSGPMPVEACGALSVSGNRILCEDGSVASLAGMSFFWSTTGWNQEKFYNADVVAWLARDWQVDLVRVAVGVEPDGGYLTDPDGNFERATRVIDAAMAEGLYVIIDWHAHHAEDHPAAAAEFFARMATLYGEHPNVIYEIYNEPMPDADWTTVIKPYSVNIIAVIRAIDPDNLILVGTQSWSQDVDKAAADPISGYANLAYTLHFYAGTHKAELRAKAQAALDGGIALFVSEWGTVNADGDGGVDYESTREWMDFIRTNGLSHANWSIADKAEASAVLQPGASRKGGWREKKLTESGRFVRDLIRSWPD